MTIYSYREREREKIEERKLDESHQDADRW
jgi:hypothetical protein